jgi:filamentous hemagglutinin family protein
MRHSFRLATVLGFPTLLPLAAPLANAATTLPVPCVATACVNSKFGSTTGFVSAGAATAVQAGSKLTVNQTTANATLNWQSFNISADGTVQFVQPSATSVALNQINDANASQIFGALNANGRVFLINQNGIIFGAGAQVNVGGLVASTLNINPAAVTGGLIAAGSNGNPAFQAFSTGTTGNVTVNSGATLQTANGGSILVFAANVTNEGTIETPGGQTVLAAGEAIYLATPNDDSLRGLLIQVGGKGGTVTNGVVNNTVASAAKLVGQILAKDGNITLAGLAVNQNGRVSATTSINENGSIRLQAGDHGSIDPSGATGVSGTLQAGTGGTLTLGVNSDTEVSLDTSDPSTTVDSVPQLKSKIDMSGYTVDLLAGSVARATSGTINITTQQSANESTTQSDGSRFYLAPNATLDVSGASIVLPVSVNVIPVELRGAELANSPLQQDGPLRSQTVYVDIRQGTPLADVSGEIAAIGHNVVERNLTGGTIAINSSGDAILAPGSLVDVAGGEIQYTAGYLDTSNLVTTTGKIVNIGVASPDVTYAGIVNTTTVSDPKWGSSTTYTQKQGTYSPGYVEGKDAGAVNISAPSFILDGNLNASTVTGLYQRQPDQRVPSGDLYRPYNQVPLAASLVVGNPGSVGSAGDNFVVNNVTIEPNLVLPTLENADGSAFDPLTDPLPASYATSVLRPQLLGSQGFGNVSIYTNGKFLEPSSVALAFPAGGSFTAIADLVAIEGSIDVPGGTIVVAAQPTVVAQANANFALTLGPAAELTARGQWVNDNPLLYPNGNTAPLDVNGGSITLAAYSNDNTYSPGVLLSPGSVLDVSGGGQLTSTGALNAGTGGAISIGASLTSGTLAGAAPRLDLGATLRGYGLYKGGSLSLTTGSVCIAAANCSGQDPSMLWVSPTELAAGGFSSYALTADAGGLSLASGTTVTLEQQNFVLPKGYQTLGDRNSLSGLSNLAVLPEQLREPVNLTLTQNDPATDNTGTAATLSVTGATPSLVIGAGAAIDADPLASITLSSDIRILVDGAIHAPGGTIALALPAGILEQTFDPTQGIWLNSTGILDVSGTAQIYPNSIGQLTGSILGGGTVNFDASRGYVELLPGSLINVAGTAGIIDLPQNVQAVAAAPVQVGSAGGSLNITAAEGVALSGNVDAAAGVSGPGAKQPAGGSFSLTLDGSTRNDYAFSFGGASSFPGDPRQIVVSAAQAPIVVSPDTPVPDSLGGFAYLSTSALQAAGFDSISLKAAPLPTPGGGALPGSIEFVGNVALTAAERISLDADTYSVSTGATANVQAPYLEFGSSNASYADVPAATSGTGTLRVAGGFIELFGTSALENIGTAEFDSSGDLRLRGLLSAVDATATNVAGGLYLDGALELSAQQIYPSTLTQFVLSADPSSVASPVAGSILVQGSAGPNQDLLSAGGSLSLSAGAVTQNGVLRAPFGSIAIDAQSIVLGANSLTSTSSDGQTIPFGTTQGGIDWIYPLPNGNDIVYGTDGIAPPAQHVTLQGTQVNVQKGAVIDVAGGGDLQAYEWIAGTGGTNDVLSQNASVGGRPGQFAIVPGLSANVAPADPNISSGTTLQVGDSVYLSGRSGLPAGVYTLLPSRYALLPGAFLVSEVSGYTDIQAGQSYPVLSGGSIISGYLTVAGTNFSAARTNGFEVVPASIVLQQAQYTTTSANQFFTSQATAAGVAASRLPEDSGVLALIASNALSLNGTLDTSAANGGLGAEVDVSSANILVAPTATTAQAGQIVLTSTSLDALGAQTLLLGGLRTGDAIDTSAQSVEIAGGVTLTAPLVLVAAQNQISVDDGASITASGTAPAGRSYSLSGDGAFLSVSAGTQSSVVRGDTSGLTGVLTLAPGSTLTAKGGSVYLEAANAVATQGTLSLTAGDLAVQSPSIVLGAAPAGTSGTVLGNSVLAGLGLHDLLLASGSAIDIYGSAAVDAQNITLDSPGLTGFGASGDAATFTAATSVTLANSQAGNAGAAGPGAGTLTIAAPAINLSGGSITASGFGTVSLTAANALGATQTSALSTSGDLGVTATEITLASDAGLSLSATGAVSLLAPTTAGKITAAPALGGSLSVSGASIDLATQIALPSGGVSLATSAGDLTLASGASINVAGIVQQYDGVSVASPGGSVSLQAAGNVTLAAGSTVDVSAGSGGQGGALTISAPTGDVSLAGTLRGTGGTGLGASFGIDAGQFGDFGALNQALNAGQFSGSRTVRLRGAGDLIVAAGVANAITANHVSLEADQGGITVNGLIDASGAQGGTVTLAAADNLTLNGTIDAHASAAGQTGGTVQLETTQGALLLTTGSTINVSGGGSGNDGPGGGGTVLLRVPSATVAAATSGGTGVALDGSIQGSSRTTLEAFTVYQNTSGVISATDSLADPSNPIYADAVSFMSNATAITAALGQSANTAFVLEPGVEIDANVASNGTGTLELDSPWDLSTWRFGANGNIPGVLTLRAQNGITFNAALSDGFSGTSGSDAFLLPTQPSDSWSYRIAAGTDLSAANPLTVNAANPAAVTLNGTMVRTGDGFIDVSASGDFLLANQQSVLYTAGVANSTGIPLPGRAGSLQGRAYPTDGGNIAIDVGGDIVGAANGTPTNQFVNAWLWRVGTSASSPTGTATAWTVDFDSFQQGVGALAGGNVSVAAGGTISDFSVSIPTIGVQIGGTTYAENDVQVTGGGNLSITAGGSILGGSYYVGRGSATLAAGGDVGASTYTALAPVIGLGDASVTVTARGNLAIADVVNPSLLNRGKDQGAGGVDAYFSTYGASSAVNLTSIGGNVVLDDATNGIEAALSTSFAGNDITDIENDLGTLNTLPPVLNVAALSGDIDVSRIIALSPSASGSLQLFANQNLNLSESSSGVAAQLIVADADPTQLPTPDAPTRQLTIYNDISNSLVAALPDQHAATPVYAASDAAGSLVPVRLVAANGNVALQPDSSGGNVEGIWSAKPVQVVAGQNVEDLNLVAQNLGTGDVTSIVAGGDISYAQQRVANGTIAADDNGITVDGPGQLQLTAGGGINLGTSAGISTRANLLNPVLPATGASISALAGIGGGTPQYAPFIAQYIQGSSQFDADLVTFVESVTGASGLSAAQAKTQFTSLSTQLQDSFVNQVFFELLQIYGSAEAASGNGDYSGAFAAITTLFPGANPNLAKGEKNPYVGDIDLYFSRIYTEQGGNISLLAPGGEINVGLALAPSSFGINKLANQLGIVAQTTGNVDAFSYTDFQVNQSRVFAADGGDILVWSTDGNIDAGRGAKTAISAPALNVVYDANGQPTVTLRAAIAGSGIQALAATPGVSPGNVYLFAPHGVVNADDAGIVAGNLTIAATAVLGANNITVSGTSVGVPVTVTGVGASFAGASATAGATANVAEGFNAAAAGASNTPVADAAMSWLDVFVTGLGEENCRPDDIECIKRENVNRPNQ